DHVPRARRDPVAGAAGGAARGRAGDADRARRTLAAFEPDQSIGAIAARVYAAFDRGSGRISRRQLAATGDAAARVLIFPSLRQVCAGTPNSSRNRATSRK